MGHGQIFHRTYKAPDGTLKTCKTWTIRWYRNGRPHEESTRYTKKGDAQRLLNLRNGDLAQGKPISAAHFRLTFDDAAKTVINDFKANGKKSLVVIERRIRKHLTPFFGGRRLADISGDHVLAYIASRKADTAIVRGAYDVRLTDGTIRRVPEHRRVATVSNAEINRELQVLKRCFSLAFKQGKVFTKPDIPMLREAPARSGFFDREHVEAITAHLPAALRPVVQFAFITGWRLQAEILPLEWRHVDFAAGEVRLLAGHTKNGQARTFPMTTELRQLLEAQQAEHDRVKKAGHIIPNVFFREVAAGRGGAKTPQPIVSMGKAWKSACEAAGYPGRILHDLRRSAVRTFVRAGLGEHVAMKLSGHLTPSVFRRYDIISPTDLLEASAKLDAAADRDSSVTVTSKRAVRGFGRKRIS